MVANSKAYMDNGQSPLLSVSFHITMSGILSVQIGSQKPAWSTMSGEGAARPDKALFSPSRIYLLGEDKDDRVGLQHSTGQPKAEW